MQHVLYTYCVVQCARSVHSAYSAHCTLSCYRYALRFQLSFLSKIFIISVFPLGMAWRFAACIGKRFGSPGRDDATSAASAVSNDATERDCAGTVRGG